MKAIPVIIFACLSGSATAAWDKVGRVEAGNNGTATVYVDRGTIRKTGSIAKMWSLFDFSQAFVTKGREQYLSSKMHWEFDCQDERGRVAFTTSHSGNMGGGHIVFSDSKTASWEPIAPDSMTLTVWKIACHERMGSENTSQPKPLDQAKIRTEYVDRIQTKIKRFIVMPQNLHGNPEVEFLIKVLPDGNVAGAMLRIPSGNTAFDKAVERAIIRAQPLPFPPDPAVAKDFGDVVLKFKAQI